jgi:putative transposase
MKRLRFSEDQIIGVLKEAEAGAKTADLALNRPGFPRGMLV